MGSPIVCRAPHPTPGSHGRHSQGFWAKIVLTAGLCVHNRNVHLLPTAGVAEMLGGQTTEKWGAAALLCGRLQKETYT